MDGVMKILKYRKRPDWRRLIKIWSENRDLLEDSISLRMDADGVVRLNNESPDVRQLRQSNHEDSGSTGER